MNKPEFSGEIIVTMPKIPEITNNISILKDFALETKKYYETLVFDDDQIKEAKGERARLNKFKLKVANLRKDKIAEFKKPIELFETTCKEVEKIIDETADFVDIQVKVAEEKEWLIKAEQIKELIPTLELMDYVDITWDEKWKNKGCSLEQIKTEINNQAIKQYEQQEQFNKELDVIKRMTSDEKYIERYKHTRDLTGILNDIENDKKVVVSKPIEVSNLISYTFTGTKEQIEALKTYARDILWLEVE